MHIRLVDRILRFQSRIIKRLTMNITNKSTDEMSWEIIEGGSRDPYRKPAEISGEARQS